MNLMDAIERNVFLEKVFPEGVADTLEIRQLCLEKSGRTTIRILVKQKPAIDVKKWGEWNKDFDTLGVVLTGSSIHNVEIENWEGSGPSSLNVSKKDDLFCFLQEGNDWKISFSCDSFIFEEIVTGLE